MSKINIWVPGSEDHSRIDVELDPTTYRTTGIAAHGNTPFSMPLISKITDDLWQGGCINGVTLPEEIVHVVSLYPWETYVYHNGVRSILSVVMYDLDRQSFEQVEAIARWINDCRKDGPTLVHCQAGLNRSSLCAATALVRSGEYAPHEAVLLLREKRSPACLCNESFQKYVLNLG